MALKFGKLHFAVSRRGGIANIMSILLSELPSHLALTSPLLHRFDQTSMQRSTASPRSLGHVPSMNPLPFNR
ncbi:hypothetical protein LZ30DRAFT_696211 [Colletotrichum cereale]|nr:hypothetical protein LZ30DRAFT_696211 [Colletotrichum cereale]